MKRPQILAVMAWHNLVLGGLLLLSGLVALSRPDGALMLLAGWSMLTAAAGLFGVDFLCRSEQNRDIVNQRDASS